MQRRFLFFLSTCFVVLFLLRARVASAQSAAPPVYVVDVRGERIDAARVRAGVGRELSVVAIAPDDPRAASATGTIDVEASATGGTLKVTFRKQEAPVTRTVQLPADPARAEIAAVFLAGNLARDEAKELLGGMKKPSPDAPAPNGAGDVAPSAATLRDDEHLRILRLSLDALSSRGKRQLRGIEWGSVAFGAAAVGGGLFLVAYHRTEISAQAGAVVAGAGGGAAIFGFVSMALSKHTTADLDEKVATAVANGGPSAGVILEIEKAWEDEAESARSSRRSQAIIAFILGGLELAGGATIELATRRNAEPSALPTILLVGGAIEIGMGVYALLVQSPVEVSYETWRKVRQGASPAANARPRPTFGFAPLPGGGAISAGFAF